MTPTTKIATVGARTLLFALASIMIVSAAQLPAVDCIEGLSNKPFDTSINCAAQPEIDRIFGTQILRWGNGRYLVGNIGNELKMWNIQNPQNPGVVDESRFNVGNVGDSDYDMYNFSVCDDCRYGVANYKRGTVLFDLGSGSQPDFGSKTIIGEANLVPGAFTFKYEGEQYLIASGLADQCSTGDSTLYEFNGVDQASGLNFVGCVTGGSSTTNIVGGFHIGDYLYLGDSSKKVLLFEIQSWGSTIALDYVSTPLLAYMIKDKGLAFDPAHNLAVQAYSTGMHVWDVSNPGSPQKLATVQGDYNRAAIAYPFVFVAKKGYKHSEATFDISNPNSPQPLDQDFWSASNVFNYPDHSCVEIQGGTFSPDGETLYLSRYSMMQIVDMAACSGPVSPTADVGLNPDPVLPGDSVTVSNESLGEVDRHAIWVTLGSDPNGNPVAGSQDLSASTPSSISFEVPLDIPVSDTYYAHVAVESDSYPYTSPTSTPDQIDSVAISVDRTPEVTISVNPRSPITGDQVTLTINAEGTPSNPSGGASMEWTVTPPAAESFQDTGSQIVVDLNESGTWTFDVVVYYEHESGSQSQPVVHTVTLQEVFDISSVFANFDYSPNNPLNTESLTLTSTSNVASDASPSYSWQITGPTNYNNCPSGANATSCTIPADTLDPGTYTFKLTLTNTANEDESIKSITNVEVGDGSINLDFTWTPTSPAIGDGITFRVQGVGAELDSATWDFGGGTCPGSGYSRTETCNPGLYTDCMTEGYMYSNSGSKTVRLTVVVDGNTFGPVSKTVNVSSSGQCEDDTPTCTYSISPSSASVPASGGSRSVSVTTQSGCAWSASTSYSWITVTGGSSGNASGTVTYSVAENTGAERSGTVKIAGKNHTVTQAEAACSYTLAAYEASYDASGGTGSVQITAASGCEWTAESRDGWITISSGASGTGTGNVHFVVDPNPWATQRVGTMAIAGNMFTVVEGPKVPTNFAISNTNPTIGETVVFTVDPGLTVKTWNFAESNCYGDTAVIDCTSRPAGFCNSFEWSYSTPGAKTITLLTTTGSIEKGLWVVNEGECCIADNPPIADFKMNPDPAMVGDLVTFSDTSTETELKALKAAITAADFTWDPNSPEIGELIEFDITGIGAVDRAEWNYGEVGCSGFPAVEVCTPLYTDCLKTSHKFASSGQKTVTLTVTVNGSQWSPVSRSLTILDQGSCGGGGGGCTYSINPSTSSYPKEGGVGAISVSTQAGCEWSASSNQSWVTINSGTPGSGSGSVNYSVAQNTGAYRTATIRVAGKNHTITQAAGDGGGCSYSLSSASASFTASGGAGTFIVDTDSGCAWQASSNQAWITITAGVAGSGSGAVMYSVAENPGGARSGSITAGGQNHVVIQSEYQGGGGNTEPTEWAWTITRGGDIVATSTEPEFTHVFEQPGLYDVEFVASNCKGESTATKTLQVDRPPIPVPDDYLVPAAIHAPGTNNTLWKTDLRLFNPGDEPVTANIEYLPEGINNNGTPIVGTNINLPPKATWINDDVVERFPVLVDDAAKGSLRITFEDSVGGQPSIAPIIMSRTYNQPPDSEGSFGQFVPAVPVIPSDEGEIYLTGLVENLYYRTNIGLANMGPEDAWILITFLDQDGVAIGEITRVVPGYSTDQVNKAAEAAGIMTDLSVYSVKIETFDNNISAFASVVDNETGDPVLYTNYRLEDEVVYIPGLAHLPGVNDSTWRSDMTFFNPMGADLDVHIEYVPAENTGESPYMEFPSMFSGTAFYFNDVVGYLLGQSAESKGYFVVSGVDGSLVPQIAGRTYSQDAISGTFGQNLKVFCESDLIEEGEAAYIAGVSNSADDSVGFRTNLGLLNVDTENWAMVTVTLFDLDGNVIASKDINLKQAEFQQPNLFGMLGLVDQDLQGSVEIAVNSKGPVAAYASQIDNTTQDPILIPAQIIVANEE